MHAAADRPEFAPPPEPALARAFALAVLAHLLLVVALTYGLHWKREAQDSAVEAELWSALPQQAAPKPEPVQPAPPPPPPQPAVKAPPKPEPPAKSEADIALEREKQKKAQEQERREAELERQRAEKAKAEAQKKREEEAARKKELAEAKRKEEERQARAQQQAVLDEKKAQARREETIRRMQGMAGTGAPGSEGTAAKSSGPSGNWAGRVQSKVRPNIVFSDNLPGNPQAVVEIRLGPGGLIIGKPRLVRSSGFPSWDEAVIRALEKTETLPPDTDGRYPSPVEISFKPKA